MGILLIIMLFIAMVGIGLWEIKRSKSRFTKAQKKLKMINKNLENNE